MASLGALGAPKQATELDFDWFGRTIRVNPYASDLVELEFLAVAGQIDLDGVDLTGDSLTAEAARKLTGAARVANNAIVGSVKRLIHPDDWQTFWDTAIVNGQNLDDLMGVSKAITEALAAVPTGRRSGSTPGPSTTEPKSPAVSPSPAAAAGGGPLSDADKALQAWAGRPDLQEFVVMQEEAAVRRAAAAG